MLAKYSITLASFELQAQNRRSWTSCFIWWSRGSFNKVILALGRSISRPAVFDTLRHHVSTWAWYFIPPFTFVLKYFFCCFSTVSIIQASISIIFTYCRRENYVISDFKCEKAPFSFFIKTTSLTLPSPLSFHQNYWGLTFLFRFRVSCRSWWYWWRLNNIDWLDWLIIKVIKNRLPLPWFAFNIRLFYFSIFWPFLP